MKIDIDIPARPLLWLLYFPAGLLTLSVLAFLAFVAWPIYVIAKLGKWTISMLGELS